MPILASTVQQRILATLDGENSDRWTFDQDIKPALNSAKDIIVSLFNEAFAMKKVSPESLREITYVKIWQANQYSRVSYDPTDTGHPLWTILAVYPNPKTNQKSSASTSGDKSKSIFMKGVSFVSSVDTAKRLNFEEWNENIKNPFMPGNEIIGGGLLEYAYLDFGNYTSTSYTGASGTYEITVRPDVSGNLVALAYLKYPKDITLESDFIEFPESLTELLKTIALSKLSEKENDGTNLYGTQKEWLTNLISLTK
ncbi:MAG TPA: hypothetical protein ACFYEK_01460 [Candidatus Wunengus sp. YC60]|uniref:hypothetical protein n=1 Tax=Candidatus Wunengus sp. YC60 TaxID=3367697 RepID=UPI00402A0375